MQQFVTVGHWTELLPLVSKYSYNSDVEALYVFFFLVFTWYIQ